MASWVANFWPMLVKCLFNRFVIIFLDFVLFLEVSSTDTFVGLTRFFLSLFKIYRVGKLIRFVTSYNTLHELISKRNICFKVLKKLPEE